MTDGKVEAPVIMRALEPEVEAILDHQVSDTTLRTRRDEWIDAGVFDQLRRRSNGCVRLHHRTRPVRGRVGRVAAHGPDGGDGTGPNPTDRAILGCKWSIAADRSGSRSAGH